MVPISTLPDEILALIFEEGMRQTMTLSLVAIIVSHVSRRWRNVALTTPSLWSNVKFIALDGDGTSQPHALEEKAEAFLSRTGLFPVDICIENFHSGDPSAKIMQQVSEHIVHCRQLRIRNISGRVLAMVLRCLSFKPMPILGSIELQSYHPISFEEPLFPLGVPRLTCVQIEAIDLITMPMCLSAFRSVTSLRLTNLHAYDLEEYAPFEHGLMAMESLTHLELEMNEFTAKSLPLVLPTIQFLHLTSYQNNLIPHIHAVSLVVLSLKGFFIEDSPKYIWPHFPALQHLIVFGNIGLAGLCQKFPNIERLTCQVLENFCHNLSDLFRSCSSLSMENGMLQRKISWMRLHTIALSVYHDSQTAVQLRIRLGTRHKAGHPIRKLLLPQERIPGDASEMAELRKVVELEDFSVDWPTPFECFDEL